MGGRIAVLVGTGSFEVDALPQLHTPATDVRALAAVLRDAYAGGFDPVIELIDASTQQVGSEIARTLDRCRRDDLVLLYFSGYALLDEEGQLHLAMHDSEPDLLNPTSISAKFLAAELARSRSRKQLVILDCRPGSGFARGVQEVPVPPPPDAERLVSAFHVNGQPLVVLAGCKALDSLDAGAPPSQPPGSSFTQALVSGMRGAADGDGDGRITIDDLYSYVATQQAEQPAARAGDAIGTQLIANAIPRSSAAPRLSSAPRGPKPGSLISDRYRIISVLAERGIGVVCSAIDETNGRHVSIKCLRPPQSSESNTLQRFLREAEIAGAIEHPSLLTVYDVGFERSTAFMVMEPLAGESLAALLRRQGRLGVRETLEIIMRATAAISAAHAHRVVHRDLNPEHIFVGRAPDGTVAQVKVLGFGVSALLDDTDLAGSRGLIGSTHYMAPEQVLGSDPPDVRADVYAFGVIMYEALTGHRPFEADNHAALLFKISNETPRPPSEWVPDLPAALEAIVLKAMARDRTSRFADVENLRLSIYESGVEHGWVRPSALPPPLPTQPVPQPAFVPKVNTPLVFDRPSSTLAPRPRRWPIALALGSTLAAFGVLWGVTASKQQRPAVSVTPLAQPQDRLKSSPPTAAEPVAVAPAPAPESAPSPAPAPEPTPEPSAAEPAEVAAAVEPATENAAGGWRAQVQARAAERRAAREAKARERAEAAAAAIEARKARERERAAAAAARAAAAAEAREAKARERAEAAAAAAEARQAKSRERAEAAEARAAAAAAAAEARAEARAEAAAIRAATHKANQAWAAQLKQPPAQAQLQSPARPAELPELKPTPQPSAAAEVPPAQAPKPEPPPAPAGSK